MSPTLYKIQSMPLGPIRIGQSIIEDREVEKIYEKFPVIKSLTAQLLPYLVNQKTGPHKKNIQTVAFWAEQVSEAYGYQALEKIQAFLDIWHHQTKYQAELVQDIDQLQVEVSDKTWDWKSENRDVNLTGPKITTEYPDFRLKNPLQPNPKRSQFFEAIEAYLIRETETGSMPMVLQSIVSLQYLLRDNYQTWRIAENNKVLQRKDILFTQENTYEGIFRDAKRALGPGFTLQRFAEIATTSVRQGSATTPHPNKLRPNPILWISKAIEMCDDNLSNDPRRQWNNQKFAENVGHILDALNHRLSKDAYKGMKNLQELRQLLRDFRDRFLFLSKKENKLNGDSQKCLSFEFRKSLIKASLDSDFVNPVKQVPDDEREEARPQFNVRFYATPVQAKKLIDALMTVLYDEDPERQRQTPDRHKFYTEVIEALKPHFRNLLPLTWEAADVDGKPNNTPKVIGRAVLGNTLDFCRHFTQDLEKYLLKGINQEADANKNNSEFMDSATRAIDLYCRIFHNFSHTMEPFLSKYKPTDEARKRVHIEKLKKLRPILESIRLVFLPELKGDLATTILGFEQTIDKFEAAYDRNPDLQPDQIEKQTQDLEADIRGCFINIQVRLQSIGNKTARLQALEKLTDSFMSSHEDGRFPDQDSLVQTLEGLRASCMRSQIGIESEKLERLYLQSLIFPLALAGFHWREEQTAHVNAISEIYELMGQDTLSTFPHKPISPKVNAVFMLSEQSNFRQLQSIFQNIYEKASEAAVTEFDCQQLLASIAPTFAGKVPEEIAQAIVELRDPKAGKDLQQKLAQFWNTVKTQIEAFEFDTVMALVGDYVETDKYEPDPRDQTLIKAVVRRFNRACNRHLNPEKSDRSIVNYIKSNLRTLQASENLPESISREISILLKESDEDEPGDTLAIDFYLRLIDLKKRVDLSEEPHLNPLKKLLSTADTIYQVIVLRTPAAEDKFEFNEAELNRFSPSVRKTLETLQLIASYPNHFDFLLQSLSQDVQGLTSLQALCKLMDIHVLAGILLEDPHVIVQIVKLLDTYKALGIEVPLVMMARSDGARQGGSLFEKIQILRSVLELIKRKILIFNGGGPDFYRGGTPHATMETFPARALASQFRFTRQGVEACDMNKNQKRANYHVELDFMILYKIALQLEINSVQGDKVGDEAEEVNISKDENDLLQIFIDSWKPYQKAVVENAELDETITRLSMAGNSFNVSSRVDARPSIEKMTDKKAVLDSARAITFCFIEKSMGQNLHMYMAGHIFLALEKRFGNKWPEIVSKLMDKFPILDHAFRGFDKAIRHKVNPLTLLTAHEQINGGKDGTELVEKMIASWKLGRHMFAKLNDYRKDLHEDESLHYPSLPVHFLIAACRKHQLLSSEKGDKDSEKGFKHSMLLAMQSYLMMETANRRFEAET